MAFGFDLPLLGGVLLCGWTVYTIVYYLFLHPLAKYPGPLLAKLSGWYEFSRVTDGNHHVWLYELHQKYGSVVRVAPNRLSYNTTEAMRTIYGDRKGYIRKAGFTEAIAHLKKGDRNLQTINDRQAYAPRRRLIAHAFSEDALRASEVFINNCIRNWTRLLQAQAPNLESWTSDVDMRVSANTVTEDILGELCFGESFGACERGKSDISDFAVEGARQAQLLSWMPFGDGFFKLLGHIICYGRDNEWESLKPQLEYDNRINAMIDRRRKLTLDRKDFFHYMIQAKDPETGSMITPGELTVEAGVLFGAGIDTSSATVAACLFYLTQYPEALKKLTAEIRSKFNDVEEIAQGSEFNSLAYLRACIDETLRCSPPTPGPLVREVCTPGITIEGDFLPPGTLVSVPSYAIHHNEKYFPDAWTWKPERWLQETSTNSSTPMATRDAFMAFSMGLRVCVGRQLAYLDMTLVLARLLYQFDVRKSPNHVDAVSAARAAQLADAERRHPGKPEYLMRDWFITGREGPFLQFRARA